MKERLLSLLLVGLMGASLVGCGGATEGGTAGGDTGKTIRLVNGKIDVDSQLKKLAEMYEKETGVHVEIESMGGGIDIQGELKAYYQSDNMPDIFVCGGAADFDNWDGLLQDMSD